MVLRELRLGGPDGPPALLAYLEGAVDAALLGGTVVPLLLEPGGRRGAQGQASPSRLPAAQVKVRRRWSDIFASLLDGWPVLFVQGDPQAYALGLADWPARAVPQADVEVSIKGSQEAFSEPLALNLALLRRQLRSERLRVTQMTLGERSRTGVALCYLEGLANPVLVESVRRRLAALRTGRAVTSATLQRHLRDQPLSLFPLSRASQRVDNAVRSLLEGKVVVLADNDPFAVAMPATVADFYQTPEDYQYSFWDGSYVRGVRLAGLLLSLYLPALYIAMTSVDPSLLPVRFLLAVAGSREGLPFPPILEVLVMFMIIEVLREASLRLPQRLGNAIGTVGAIVLGTAIVRAGLVSSQMIIVVTLTALAVFTLPDLAMSAPLRLLMWVFVLGASTFGVYGMLICTWWLLGYAARLSSINQPFLAPYGPLVPRDLADTAILLPRFWLRMRPVKTHAVDAVLEAPYRQPAERPQPEAAQRRHRSGAV